MSRYGLLVKRIGLVAITNFLVELNGLVLLPVLTKNLSISDYGIWVQIMVTVGLIPAIALLGLPFSMVRFLSSVKNREDFQEMFYTMAAIISLAAFVVAALIFLLSGPISSALFNGDRAIVQALSLLVFVECLNNIPFNYFRTVQQIKKYSAFSTLKVALIVSLISYFVLSGQGIRGAVLGLLISGLIVFLFMSAFVISDIGFGIPRFRNVREYISFGMPTVPGNLSGWVVNSSDRYVIGLLMGTAAVGYYSPGYTLGNIINIFIAPILFLLPAVLCRHYDECNLDEVRSVLDFSTKYFLALAIPSAFGLTILSRPLLTELSTAEIASQGYLITPFVALGAIFLGAYALTSQVIILEKKTALTGMIWVIAAILNLALNFLLVPYLGILGAAMTTLVAFALAFFATAYYSNRHLYFNFNLGFLIRSVLASGVMSLLLLWMNPEGLLSLGVAVAGGAVVYFAALILLGGISREEINSLRKML